VIDARDKRRLPHVIAFLPALAACALAVATVSGFLGRWWWAFDLFVHFRPHLAVAGVALLVAALVLRRRWVAVAAFAATATNAVPILPYLDLRAAAPDLPPANLRLLTFNLHGSDTNPAALRRLIEAERPDIVVLTELPGDLRPILAGVGPSLPYRMIARRYSTFDIALFSRWRFAGARIDRSVDPSFPVLYADVCDDAEWAGCVRIVGLHASRPFAKMAGGFTDGRPWQQGQFAIAERFAATAPGGRAVVVGDLNLTPWSPAFGDLLARSGLYDTARGLRLSATWLSPLPFVGLMIDHVLASPDIAARDNRVGPDLGSDHRPVLADLAVPQRAQ
jgi:endonuclease/exonuclease/phosphatase (EEP) superfamily protein YafD